MTASPRSVIHVGFTNTGTTSLQLNFFARRKDIFYVGTPYNDFGGIFSHLRYMETFKYDEAYVRRLCNEQIFSKAQGRPIVISDETLCDSPQIYFAPYLVPRDIIAFRLFRLFQPAKIVFTIRRQEDYISSMYLNLKRNYAFFDRMPLPAISRWYRGMMSQLRCNYLQNINFHEVIEMYEGIFGRDKILVLPIERLIFDGPGQYLRVLSDFMEIDLSDEDTRLYAHPRNVRMSRVEDLAAELFPDDKFFGFYSSLEQAFGRDSFQQVLTGAERAAASLTEDYLAELRERVGSGNRLVSEKYNLQLERFGYALAAMPLAAKRSIAGRAMPPRRESANRVKQLQTIIDSQRLAHASQLADMQAALQAERHAAERTRELETRLKTEHDALVARVRELKRMIEADRRAYAARILDLQMTFEPERRAAVARIRELEARLKAEHAAFIARIGELERAVETDRRACRAAAAALEREQALRAEAEAGRDAIRQSSCWRFTAPVRAMIDLFKRTNTKS